jgi:membrane-associated phospholipid phosphatase
MLCLSMIAINTGWLLASERLSLDTLAYLTVPNNILLLLVLIAGYARPTLAANNLYQYLAGGLGLVFLYLNLRIFNHLCFSIPVPWSDDVLISWSDALGLDWVSYAEWLLANEQLAYMTEICYLRVEIPLVIIFVFFCILKKQGIQSGYILSVALTAITCSVISAFFPAKAAIQTIAPIDLARSLPIGQGSYQIVFIEAPQNAYHHTLRPAALPGLSTFPSFHTALGVLIIFWSWRANWAVGALCTVYSLLMIAATPVFGGHYFIDLVFGALIALLFAVAACPILNRYGFATIPPMAAVTHAR